MLLMTIYTIHTQCLTAATRRATFTLTSYPQVREKIASSSIIVYCHNFFLTNIRIPLNLAFYIGNVHQPDICISEESLPVEIEAQPDDLLEDAVRKKYVWYGMVLYPTSFISLRITNTAIAIISVQQQRCFDGKLACFALC